MKKLNQFKLFCLLAVLFTMVGTPAWAGNNNKTYYSKVNVTASGSGKVYVSTTNTTPSSTDYATTKSANQNSSASSAPNHSYYLKAQADDGYKFVKWVDGTTLVSESSSYTATFSASSTSNSDPTTKNYTAVFEKILYYNYAAEAKTDGNGTASVSFDNKTFASTANATATTTSTKAYFKATGSGEYAFAYWTDENGITVSYETPYVVDLTNDEAGTTVSKTLTAHFASPSYYNFSASALRNISAGGKTTVVLASSGKTTSSKTSSNGQASESATFNVYCNAGYHFLGWGETADATTYVSTDTEYTCTFTNTEEGSTANKTLYAIFEQDAAPAVDNTNYYTKMIIKQHPTSPKGAGVVGVLAGNDTSDSETAPSLSSATYSNEAYLLRKGTKDTSGEETTYDNKFWLCAKANAGYEFVGFAENTTTSFRAKANPYEMLITCDLTHKGSTDPTEKVYYAVFQKIIEPSGEEDIKTPTTTGKMTVSPGDGSTVTTIETIYVTTNGTSDKKQYRYMGSDLDKMGRSSTLAVEQQLNGNWIEVGKMKVGSSSQPSGYEFKYPFTVSPRITSPGTYRIVIPKETFGIYAGGVWGNFANPDDITLNLTIAGEVADAAVILAHNETNPVQNGKVVDELRQISLTFPESIVDADRDALSIFTEDGDYVCNSTYYTLRDYKKTIVFNIPALSYGNYYIGLDGGSVRGEGWENAEVNESEHNLHFSVVQDLKPRLVWSADNWKLESLTFEAEGHSNIYMCYNDMHNHSSKNDIYVYNKETGARTNVALAANDTKDAETGEYSYLKYDGNKVTMIFALKNVLIGEGTYYFDIPAQTFSSDGIYNETELHYEFTLAAPQPTNFTVSPAAGSTLSKIDKFVLTVTDAKSSIAATGADKVLYVSKDGGTPIKYNIFEYERDGDTSGGNEYGSAEQLTIDGNKATILIAEGFKSAVETYDNYGFRSSGVYTITVPAGLFYIDGLEDYLTTDMTFTYVVKNNVVESRDYKGKATLVSPSDEEIYTDVAEELKTIVLHIEDADNFAVETITAKINNEMELESYSVDEEAMTLTLNMKPIDGKPMTTSGEVVLTVSGEFTANGLLYGLGDDIDDFADYEKILDAMEYTFIIQTEEEKNRSNIIITPESGTTVDKIAVMKMELREPEKFTSNIRHSEGLKVAILRGEEETGYYVTWASAKAVNDAGLTETISNQGLKVVDAEGNDAEFAHGGTYNFTLPEGFYTFEAVGTFTEVPSKITRVEYTIPFDEDDLNEDGYITIADVTEVVKKQLSEDNHSTERINKMVNSLLEK